MEKDLLMSENNTMTVPELQALILQLQETVQSILSKTPSTFGPKTYQKGDILAPKGKVVYGSAAKNITIQGKDGKISFFSEGTEIGYLEITRSGDSGFLKLYSADGAAGITIEYDVAAQQFTALSFGGFNQAGTSTNGGVGMTDQSGNGESRNLGVSHSSGGTPYAWTDAIFNFVQLTTAQRDSGTVVLSPVAGSVIFNTTLGKLQVYNGASWETITSV